MSHSLPPSGGRRGSRAIFPRTKLSTSSLYRRSITRRDRCEMRSSVRRKAFLLKGLQNDAPLFGETILDLLEQDVGAGLRLRHLPGMLLHQRLDLPVERHFPLEILPDLADHFRQQDVFGGLRPDHPLLLPAGEDRLADPLEIFFANLQPLLLTGAATQVRKSSPTTPLRRYLSIETAQGQSLSFTESDRAAAIARRGMAFFARSTRPALFAGSIPSKSVARRYGRGLTPSAYFVRYPTGA